MRLAIFKNRKDSEAVAVWPDDIWPAEAHGVVDLYNKYTGQPFMTVGGTLAEAVAKIEHAMYDMPDGVVEQKIEEKLKGEERENREAVPVTSYTCGFCGEKYSPEDNQVAIGLCWKCHEAGREI